MLKEYCAEIESLKNQLQLTREKNGVYVDPNEFYSMEARLSTQEAQIAECEAALRARNEEVKSLRVGFDEVTEKYEAAQKEVRVGGKAPPVNRWTAHSCIILFSLSCVRQVLDGRAQLEALGAALRAAQEELATTKTELQAAEAVVKAQTRTERMLHTQGRSLQDEVTTRRDEVVSLLGKVGRLSDNEADRIKKAARFVAEVDNHKAQLLDGISMIAFQSKTQSSVLCNGVSEMLAKGKATCSSLKAAIDGALSILIHDAKAAKDTMTGSCDKLSAHLLHTNGHVASTLRALQADLSDWLGDVDNGMATARQHLAAQNSQLDGLSASIASQIVGTAEMSTAFVQQQQADLAAAQVATAALRDELCTLFQEYHDDHKRELEETKALMSEKALAMEEAMRAMLADMMASASAALDLRVAHTASFASVAADKTTVSVRDLDVALGAASEAAQNATQAIHKSVDDAAKEHVFMLAAASNSRQKTDDILGGISGDVGAKRANLDETVTVLVSHVDQAIEEGCAAVAATSETANVILREVTSATESMTASAGRAMEVFVEYMDGKGQAVHEELGQHFVGLDAHFISQKAGVSLVSKVTDMYGNDTANSATGTTGQTPRKAVYPPLSDLVKTRDHDAIRADARAGKVGLVDDDAVGADAFVPTDRAEAEEAGAGAGHAVSAPALEAALAAVAEESIAESKGSDAVADVADVVLTVDGDGDQSEHLPRSRSSTMSRSGKTRYALLAPWACPSLFFLNSHVSFPCPFFPGQPDVGLGW